MRRPLSQFVERGGFPTVRSFPRDRGGGSDVKHDRDDIPENCARWSGKWMSFGRFVCGLVTVQLLSETTVLRIFVSFLQITLGAFQRTYSELLAHLESGDTGIRSG